MKNYVLKRQSGVQLHALSKLYNVHFGFVPLNCIALFAVAEGWLLLDIG